MSDPWIVEIDRLTVGIRALRIVHHLIHRRYEDMPRLLEIKGLGGDIASIKKGIGDLRVAASELNTEGAALKAEIVDLKEQIVQHRSDLRFEAETLGNGNGSDEQSDKEQKQVDKLITSKEVTGTANSSDSFPDSGTTKTI